MVQPREPKQKWENNFKFVFPEFNRQGHVPVMVQPREPKQKWENNFKIVFPEFNGSLIAEDFVDWPNQVERILEYHEIPNHKRVKLIAIS